MTTHEGLQQAGRCFLQGKLSQCKTLLDNLPLIDIQESVVLQLVQESNLILCKEEVTVLRPGEFNEVPSSAAVKQILQKLKGLPVSKKLLPLELVLTYNETVVRHLESGDAVQLMNMKGMISELEKTIMLCLQRFRTALKLTKNPRNLGIEEQLQDILQVYDDTDTATCLTLLSCVLSAYYIVHKDTDKAMSVLDTVKHHISQLSTSKEQSKSTFSLLMKLPSQNLKVKLCRDPSGASTVLITSFLVDFLKSCCHLKDEKFSSCLKLLQTARKTSLSPYMLPLWEYMKAYCLYQEDSDFEAAQCLYELLKSSSGVHCDSTMKARCLNLIGCCMAKQDHLNTAIQSFRDALHEDFSYLEPLYNLSLIYRQQKLWDAELESLNLLVTAIENQEEENSSSSSKSGVVFRLSADNGSGYSEGYRQQGCSIQLTSALYTFAKRCLLLKRYNAAAEKYLDLLSVIEESDVLLHTSSKLSKDGIMAMPSAVNIYLEAALALYKAGQPEEALLVCDQILAKVTKPAVAAVGTSSIKLKTDATKTHDNSLKHVKEIASTSTESRKLDLSKASVSPTARKRPREDDSIKGQSSEVVTDPLMPCMMGNQTKWRHLHLFCSALLLKSQCCRAVNQFSKVEEMLDDILDILKGLTNVDALNVDSPDGGIDDPMSTPLEPQTKKRRVDRGSDQSGAQSNHPTHPQEPIIQSLLELKTQAGNDKSLILIGQGKLKEAMKILLRSLHYQPDNEDTLYNYILLLLRMGRKEDAKDAFKKYTAIPGVTSTKMNELEKALR